MQWPPVPFVSPQTRWPWARCSGAARLWTCSRPSSTPPRTPPAHTSWCSPPLPPSRWHLQITPTRMASAPPTVSEGKSLGSGQEWTPRAQGSAQTPHHPGKGTVQGFSYRGRLCFPWVCLQSHTGYSQRDKDQPMHQVAQTRMCFVLLWLAQASCCFPVMLYIMPCCVQSWQEGGTCGWVGKISQPEIPWCPQSTFKLNLQSESARLWLMLYIQISIFLLCPKSFKWVQSNLNQE